VQNEEPLNEYPQSITVQRGGAMIYEGTQMKVGHVRFEDLEVGDKFTSQGCPVFTVTYKTRAQVHIKWVLQGITSEMSVNAHTFMSPFEYVLDDASTWLAPSTNAPPAPERCKYGSKQREPRGDYDRELDYGDTHWRTAEIRGLARRSVQRQIKDWPICNMGNTVDLRWDDGQCHWFCVGCFNKQ
jgi:hypothetical protein